jgi:hypothetical protein
MMRLSPAPFRRRPLLWLVPVALLAWPASGLRAQTAPPSATAISPAEQQGIDRDIARHFGDAPENPGPKAKLSPSTRPASVRHAMQKVADWELNRSQPSAALAGARCSAGLAGLGPPRPDCASVCHCHLAR